MKKVVVALMLEPDTQSGTMLWVNDKVADMFLKLSGEVGAPPLGRLEEKMRYFCNANLRLFMPNAVKLEYGKTYGIHIDQYRIVGFFDKRYESFVALDWFVKKTQRNDRRMNVIYRKVDEIRETGAWIKDE